MSEMPEQSPNQVQRIATTLPPMPVDPKKSSSLQDKPPTAFSRVLLFLLFLLFIGVIITYLPEIAQEIAYSWNRGVERAKTESAKKWLAEYPHSKTDQRIAWVAQAVSPSVVGLQVISARSSQRQRGDDDQPLEELDRINTNVGSGVIVDPKGYILTNYHVIAHAQVVVVQLSDGRTVEAEIIGQDRSVDLAVLRIGIDNLTAIEWGDSRQAVVGEQVVAIGNPYGLRQTVTSGIISATERYDDTTSPAQWTSRGRISDPQVFLQTDAAINPGNSGGALVDMNGKLIGICTAIISEHGSNSGIGLVIPSFKAKLIYDEIVSYGSVKHGWIGAELDQVKLYHAQKMKQEKPMGAIIAGVFDESPAAEAGLEKGDIILRWGETEIASPLHLIHTVLFSKPGTKEKVEVFRDDEVITLEITVGTRPQNWQ